jgi:mono/diheme cytochrome c family protein
MRARRAGSGAWSLFGAAVWWLLAATAWGAEADLRRGLVATYRDDARPTAREVVRIEPTVALALKAGEAPHSRLSGTDGTARWQGLLTVARGGKYRFDVRLRGRFRLEIAGREVLAAEVREDRPARRQGPEVQLEAGDHPLTAEFTRPAGAAVVELSWSAPFFFREPLPSDVLGHRAAQEDERLAADAQRERGRRLAEESGCMRCHAPADGDRMAAGLTAHLGPDLSRVGRRVRAGWLFRWLESPRKLRPATVMPDLFPPDEVGRTECYAVARYLASLDGPVKGERKEESNAPALARGQRLWAAAGCAACHGERDGGGPPRPAIYPLGGLGSKTTPERLAEYLRDPLAVAPAGRMPSLGLAADEAADLACFLCASRTEGLGEDLPAPPAPEYRRAAFRRVDSRPDEWAAFEKLSEAEQWRDLGKRLVIDRGCNNCHTIAPDGQPFAMVLASASLDDVRQPARQGSGCLAEEGAKRGPAPAFGFGPPERAALRAFLRDGLSGAGSPAPAYAARQALERLNCLACHRRDGEGGLAPAIVEHLRKLQKADHDEAVTPPPLTGVGHKLSTPWLRQVLSGDRARPWMALRMPQFGAANVAGLPEALASLDGTESEEEPRRVVPTRARIDAGRLLAGPKGFACVSCHDLGGTPGSSTRGPDLALLTRRIRYDWFRRWLEQPQRMQPGTRMPAVFSGGKSLLEKVLDGTADSQAEALWAYLSLGPTLPRPEGVAPR